MTPVTGVILNWKRPGNVCEILESWQASPVVSGAIVWNNNPQCPFTHGWARVVNTSSDFGLYSRFAAAALAETDAVLFQDDDMLLPSVSIERLVSARNDDPDVLHGVVGRRPRADGSYAERVVGDSPCPIVLTRAVVASTLHAAQFLAVARSFDHLQRHAVPAGNGEDILFSYVRMRASGRLNRVHDVAYEDLPDGDAIHRRNPHAHYAHRTAVLRECERWLKEPAAPDHDRPGAEAPVS